MSALQFRAIWPSRVDLPTPEPANRPMRCPSPRVKKPSITRTPVGMTVSMRLRVMELGGGFMRG
ncbi:hypothetical protein D3C87_2052490 [compost metagenome]